MSDTIIFFLLFSDSNVPPLFLLSPFRPFVPYNLPGSMACYKVIASMEENFPVEKLYSFIGSTEDDLDRKAERAVYDYISGEIVVDRTYSSSTKSDPMQDTLTVLERRDTNVNLTRTRLGSSENATSA